jgi:predicted RNA-binding protein with PUA-like domain
MAAYWLVKSEPDVYAYRDLERDGKTRWDGVRNFQARGHLRAMKKGDLVLYYHTGDEKAVVGIARVSREAYPDPTAPGEDFSCVDLEPVRALGRPVPLAEIKKAPVLKDMILLKQARLSVQPVTKAEFESLTRGLQP